MIKIFDTTLMEGKQSPIDIRNKRLKKQINKIKFLTGVDINERFIF